MSVRSEASKEKDRVSKKAYNAKPEVKERRRAYQKVYNATPETREKRRLFKKAYNATSEVKEKRRAYHKVSYAKPEIREQQRKSSLRRDFGITLEQYDTMLQGQGKTCAICNHKNANGKRLAVDHCHGTGKIRGLLCSGCNVSLGHLKDSPTILASALRYLAKHGKVLTTEAVFLLTVELHQSTME